MELYFTKILFIFFWFSVCYLAINMPGSFSLFLLVIGPVIGNLCGLNIIGCIVLLVISIIITSLLYKRFQKDSFNIKSEILQCLLLFIGATGLAFTFMFDLSVIDIINIIANPILLSDYHIESINIYMFLFIELNIIIGIIISRKSGLLDFKNI